MVHTIKEVLPVLHPYWTFCEELTIEDGLILKGTRIVLPSKQWEAILNQIHDSHLGLQKCKLWAMQSVYWPGINDQLKQLVLNCQLCLKYLWSKKKPDTSSSLGQEIPLFPCTKLATDIFHFEGELISSTCKLHQLLSHSVEVEINDCSAYYWPHQTDFCGIWVAQHNSFRQWTMLHQQNLQKVDDRIQS